MCVVQVKLLFIFPLICCRRGIVKNRKQYFHIIPTCFVFAMQSRTRNGFLFPFKLHIKWSYFRPPETLSSLRTMIPAGLRGAPLYREARVSSTAQEDNIEFCTTQTHLACMFGLQKKVRCNYAMPELLEQPVWESRVLALRKIDFWFLSNLKEYDRSDGFLSVYELNVIPFGSYSKGTKTWFSKCVLAILCSKNNASQTNRLRLSW